MTKNDLIGMCKIIPVSKSRNTLQNGYECEARAHEKSSEKAKSFIQRRHEKVKCEHTPCAPRPDRKKLNEST